jgi:hypothetical protein
LPNVGGNEFGQLLLEGLVKETGSGGAKAGQAGMCRQRRGLKQIQERAVNKNLFIIRF